MNPAAIAASPFTFFLPPSPHDEREDDRIIEEGEYARVVTFSSSPPFVREILAEVL